ncbi:sporulation YhaL family protein [Bacillus sp. FJAT-29790]|uniref:sporulation YhaL family protein n=1 Tax=Bacillus sp. FJAT-29790 TaxID=1895002 RepID=UPI0020B281F6|nr:sporulation YhaL family protein [Bacillus sp. FJAT-29790]
MIIPIWVYFAAIGILLSAYMAIRTGREEREEENESIELEGRIYMERLEKEREARRASRQSLEV